jgi:dephospho-CoA kinase
MGAVVEFVGLWGVGKTTLARRLLSELEVHDEAVFGRDLARPMTPVQTAISQPVTALRLTARSGRAFPELVGTRAGRRIAYAHLRHSAVERRSDAVILLDRGAAANACAILAHENAVSAQLLIRLMPTRNLLNILVEAPPEVIRERMLAQGTGRDPASRRGMLAIDEPDGPAWVKALEAYEAVKAALLAMATPTIIIDNRGDTDLAHVLERVLELRLQRGAVSASQGARPGDHRAAV